MKGDKDAQLQASCENFRSVVMQAPVGMCIISGQPLMVDEVNDLFLGIIGKERDQFKTTPYWEVNGEMATHSSPITDRVLQNGKTYWAHEREIRRVRNGKEEIAYFDFVYGPLIQVGSAANAIMIVAIDVTDRVKARKAVEKNASEFQSLNEEFAILNEELAATNEEFVASNEELAAANEELAAANEELGATNDELAEAQHSLQRLYAELAESESRLRMAITATDLGTWDWNPQNGALYWSEACKGIYGLSPSQSVSFNDFSEHLFPDDRAHVLGEIKSAMDPTGDGRYDTAYRILRFDNNETRWVKAQGMVFFDTEGRAERFIGTVLDITESKVAQEKSARLAEIVESSEDAIISKTTESVITSWNAAAERMFGYAADEIIGETIYKLIPADRHEEEPRILKRLKKGERVAHFETKRMAKDGRLLDVSLTISPLKDADGNIIGLSKIMRDITEKKLEEQRKNYFIGMASHELKTPLTSLNGIIQVANARLKNSDDVFLTGAMQKAIIQMKKMTAMINGFLNISRLETGEMPLQKEVFNVNDLLREILEENSLAVNSHGILLTSAGRVMVNADREKISSVVSNLVNNAIKYSPRGTTVLLGCRQKKKRVVVSVKDEGLGIDHKELDKIFDRYYRIESAFTRHISGFGIGLHLSAEIVERHNGKIWAESEPGKGSTFYFELPIE